MAYSNLFTPKLHLSKDHDMRTRRSTRIVIAFSLTLLATLGVISLTGSSSSVVQMNSSSTLCFRDLQNVGIGLRPTVVTVADVNNDTKPDLITNSQEPSFAILLGRGDGTFE